MGCVRTARGKYVNVLLLLPLFMRQDNHPIKFLVQLGLLNIFFHLPELFLCHFSEPEVELGQVSEVVCLF